MKYWGKILFIITLVSSFLLSLVYGGCVVQGSLESICYEVIFVLDGIIVTMLLSGSISEEFNLTTMDWERKLLLS